MSDLDILGVLSDLSVLRPISNNEADFQFSLAWEIQKHYPHNNIRLEYKVPLAKRTFVDILVSKTESVAIELKYKPKHVVATINNETFDLVEKVRRIKADMTFLKTFKE